MIMLGRDAVLLMLLWDGTVVAAGSPASAGI